MYIQKSCTNIENYALDKGRALKNRTICAFNLLLWETEKVRSSVLASDCLSSTVCLPSDLGRLFNIPEPHSHVLTAGKRFTSTPDACVSTLHILHF